ncbi:MAG TPA: hypothetical protein VHV27_10170 [Phenylobacterium sp.]|nr:hypothetical protein [Phenylobacterium sp.]
MLLALVASLALSGFAGPAGSSGAAPVTAPDSAAPQATKTAVADTICWVEAPVGSHIPHRYCASRAYWEQRQRTDQHALSPFYHSGGGGAAGGAMGPSSSSSGGPGG